MCHISQKQYDVSCVGMLCADVLARPVNNLPPRGGLDLVENISIQSGGCGANASICLSRLGVTTVLFGRVGKDSIGNFLYDVLEKEGVRTEGLRKDSTLPTSSSVVCIDSKGERSILHCLGANAHFSITDVHTEIILSSRILFIAGTFLMPAFDGEGTLSLTRLAYENGVTCCLDTHWDSSGRWMELIRDAMPYLHWFMPSETEAFHLSGEKEPGAMARRFQSLGAQNVIIKLGERGCFIMQEGEEGFFSPAYRVQAVDASGAGDAFCAGFIAGLARGWSAKDSARLANAVGGCCVRKVGTTPGVECFENTLAFMEHTASIGK